MGRPRLPAGPEPVDILEDVAVLGALPSLGRRQPGDGLAELLLLAHLAQVALDGGVGGGEADAGADLDGLHWGALLALDVYILPHARTLVKGAVQNFIESSQFPLVGMECLPLHPLTLGLKVDGGVTGLGPLLAVGSVVVDQDALFLHVIDLASLGDDDDVVDVHGRNVLLEPVDLALRAVGVGGLGEDVAGDALRDHVVDDGDVFGEGLEVRHGVALEGNRAILRVCGVEVGQDAVHVPVEGLSHWCVPLALDVPIIHPPGPLVKPLFVESDHV